MVKESETYQQHVEKLETGLAPYAKRSFESFSQQFIDGGEIYSYYERQWRGPAGALKYFNRTPLQLERDRILYSPGMRKQTEKYHVLYNGQRRIVRNYTTHTMRMAQVARSICRGLGLNSDFAEAMAMGSKVGAVPFVHAAKAPIADWVKNKVLELDEQYAKNDPLATTPRKQLSLEFGENAIPSWISRLRSSSVFGKARSYIPWAAGTEADLAYCTGQESYWLLTTNPLILEANPSTYVPETMYGIWRHTRGLRPDKDSFHHRCQIAGATSGVQEIRSNHCTYEATVIQYADDITWVIENLNDANSAALLNKRRSIYEGVLSTLEEQVPEGLLRPLSRNDAGGVYTYFISDFIHYSRDVLSKISDGLVGRIALREGKATSFIGLSPEAEQQLDKLASFLYNEVFTEPRVKNRTQMLKTVSVACMDLLYSGAEDILPKLINERATLERWPPEKLNKAIELVGDPVHRVQLAVDIFADMGDQEIYDFVGIQSL